MVHAGNQNGFIPNALLMFTSGCLECKTNSGCDFTRFRDKRIEIKNEVGMRSKALADLNFPNEALVQEYLNHKDNIDNIDFSWKHPDLVHFVNFATRHLQWEQLYAFQKFLPIYTRWQLKHARDSQMKSQLLPDRIKKIRKLKGVASYEIVWSDSTNYYKDLIPSQQLANVNLESLWSTVEPQDLVRNAHLHLVQAFDDSRKPKASKRRKKNVNDIEKMLANTSITDSPKPKKSRRKQQTKPSNTIDLYFKKAILSKLEKENQRLSQDLSRFGDEDNLDLSDIIDDIVNRGRPSYIEENLHALGYCSTPKRERFIESSFFISNSILEEDLFEKSMNVVNDLVSSDSSSDENEVNDIVAEVENANDDTFVEEYVPLLTRITDKMH